MCIKSKIRKNLFKNKATKKIYCVVSYIKRKMYYGLTLGMPILKYKLFCKNPVFLIFTPEHANLGDHAIAYSEQIMLDKLKITYYEITGMQLYKLQQYKFLKLLNHATVLINGGGNLGTLWPDIEKMNRWIISEIKKSTICILPNSIYYGSDEKGQNELLKSIAIYNSHQKLFLYAREKKSYELMRNIYINVKIVPDMVLNLNVCYVQLHRTGCLFCMRDDIEKTVTEQEFQQLYNAAKEIFETVSYTNTVLNYNVSVTQRQEELRKKFDEFKKAELVITDRLHGMIFCAITGTKCIVLNGKSPKIAGCFEWIKNLGYIALIDKATDMKKVYQSMQDYPNYYNNKNMEQLFQNLENDITNIVRYGEWK